MFEVVLHDRARKNYERLPTRAVRLINRGLEQLEHNPFFGLNIKKLHGELQGCYRLRSGEYRIVYHIDREQRIVVVDALDGRGNIY